MTKVFGNILGDVDQLTISRSYKNKSGQGLEKGENTRYKENWSTDYRKYEYTFRNNSMVQTLSTFEFFFDFFFILFCYLHYENKPIQIYWKFYHPKQWKFSYNNSDSFHISAQNIDCGYSLEPPRRSGSNEYPQSMFVSRNKKNNVYPCKPKFHYIKRGV